ncbi:THO complex subunit 6 homolog [Mya arenaria]|uniref:THO complex subunit 6 homolog n=1 Tax=Mya arenaria TaxID=6604 RepID=UPI0022E89AA8|nr:THO complex subunit 6 homolog [Mya arenaria]
MTGTDRSKRQLLHTTVFAQCFSPCGKYLVAANNYGQIAVYSIVAALSPNADEETRKPIYSFDGLSKGKPVYCLLSTDTHLISAGNGDIVAWGWSEILDKAAKVAWTLQLPKLQMYTDPEVNTIALNKQDTGTELLAGCGDNNVHIWDIESGNLTSTLSGHKDYIHCLCTKNAGRECVTASEDGTVRIWDCRQGGEAVQILDPSSHEATARPSLGKWVACVTCDVNEDWLVCGGAPHLSAWHLRSLSPMTTYNSPGATHNFAMYHEDLLLSGGSSPYVNHWFVNGDRKSQVPCSATSVFSVAINSKSECNKVLSVAGSSSKIDICTNFGYKAFSLVFDV